MSVRLWRVAALVGAVAVLVASWFLLVNPQRQKAADLALQTEGEQAASTQLRSRISLLKKQSEELPAQEARLAAIEQQIPETTALATLIRKLSGLADGANVKVTGLDPGRPAPLAVQQVAPTAPVEESGEADDAEDAAAAAAPAPAAVPTVRTVSLSIGVCGDYSQIRNYLKELETMRRAVAVTNLSIARGVCTGSETEQLTAQISASAFTMPAAGTAGAAGTGTAAGATTGAS